MPLPGNNPDPILLQIVADAQAALDAVAPPDYPVTLDTVRPTQLKPVVTEGRCEIELGNADRAPMTETSNGKIRWHQQLLVSVMIMIPEDNRTTFDQMFAWYAASIEKALLADVSRGGLAFDTIPHGVIFDYLPQGCCVLQSTFVIDYQTLYGDPWSL